MPTHFTKHRGNGTPSVLNIEWDRSPYSLACPQCGFEYVHVEHVRIAPHGDRSRASAQIAMSCFDINSLVRTKPVSSWSVSRASSGDPSGMCAINRTFHALF